MSARRQNTLLFGPYAMPRCKIGQRVECLYRGTVRIVAISDAPQQWPIGLYRLEKSPVLMGSLARAVRREAACDIALAWGVGRNLVTTWRKILKVGITKGTHQRMSDGIRGSDPERASKIAKSKRGRKRPASVIEAMREANLGRRASNATKRKISKAHKRRGTRPPWLNPARTSEEDRLIRTKAPTDVARMSGRSLSAIYSRRSELGVNNGRTTGHHRPNE